MRHSHTGWFICIDACGSDQIDYPVDVVMTHEWRFDFPLTNFKATFSSLLALASKQSTSCKQQPHRDITDRLDWLKRAIPLTHLRRQTNRDVDIFTSPKLVKSLLWKYQQRAWDVMSGGSLNDTGVGINEYLAIVISCSFLRHIKIQWRYK